MIDIDKEKGAFLVFKCHAEDIEELTDVQAGRLFKALYRYNSEGKDDTNFTDDPILRYLWRQFKHESDYNNEKWANTKQKRHDSAVNAANTRWGNNAKKCERMQPHMEAIRLDTPNAVNDNVNVNDNVYVYDNGCHSPRKSKHYDLTDYNKELIDRVMNYNPESDTKPRAVHTEMSESS